MSTKLNEYDSTEWFDIAKFLNVDITEEEFDEMWKEFHIEKERRRKESLLN